MSHPDDMVVEEVESIAELADYGRDTEDRVANSQCFDSSLEVLEWFAESHHCCLEPISSEPAYSEIALTNPFAWFLEQS
jgi:hypothetical protein